MRVVERSSQSGGFQACHNHLRVGEGKGARQEGTPATRLGLAKVPLDYTDIIYLC